MPDDVKRRCAELRAAGKPWADIAAEVGYPKSVVQKWAGRATGDGVAPPTDTSEWDESGDKATLKGETATAIKSEEDVYRAFDVDRTRWRIVRMRKKAWQVMAKVGSEREGYRLETRQMYGVTADLERIVKKEIENALDLVFARFKDAAPKWPKVDKGRASGEPFLAVMGLMDAHFGKYCWEGETGENYDLKIAESVFANAVEDLLAECRNRNVVRFLVPFGNDFMHFDGRTFQTTKGTQQDADGRFSKVLATAKIAAINAVERMAAVAPVQVELVAGNHDRTMAECLCHMIDARFHRSDRVTVNTSPKSRKYVRFGANLIGLTHGDMVKAERLPGLMAAEAKRDWADTTCHEWVIGHGHRSQKWVTKDTDTQQGTVVRMLRALTRSDLWHYDSGYIQSAEFPAAEVYLYGRDRGYAGHAIVPARGG
jgi:predicted phosphodiesterase